MKEKLETYLADARKWLEKNSGSELDLRNAKLCLESAEKAAREVDVLKDQLEASSEEMRVAFLVLDETLKSAKHARKALDAREKAVKKTAKPKEKKPVEKGVTLAEGPKKSK
jgi:hypothetical protein